jgi:hypothetical protein
MNITYKTVESERQYIGIKKQRKQKDKDKDKLAFAGK